MHEGHRKRLCARLKDDGDGLCDHELLEILLFNSRPRINTNPAAHALLEKFSSLEGVFAAEADELMAVPGVGEQTAYYLTAIGQCFKRIAHAEEFVRLNSIQDCKNFISKRFRGVDKEIMEVYFTEKNGSLKGIFNHTSWDRNKVSFPTDRLSAEMVAVKPYGIVVAHNHLNGSSEPSANDEAFTAQLQLLCDLNNVILLDHIIYASDENIFSYSYTGKIEDIRSSYSLESIKKWTTHTD